MKKRITIAIDGYSSCGKSTLAKALAAKLHYVFVDTGAMYRAIALYCTRNQLVEGKEIKARELLSHLDLIEMHFELNQETKLPELFLNGENVDHLLRTLEISSLVSKVAVIKEVRAKLVQIQRKIGKRGGVVMDGRDIGSVVFPQAELKLFLTAEVGIRTERRYLELKAKNQEISIEEVAENLKERDFIDTTRKESPLIQSEDAIVIDNSYLTPDQQLEKAYQLALDKIGEHVKV